MTPVEEAALRADNERLRAQVGELLGVMETRRKIGRDQETTIQDMTRALHHVTSNHETRVKAARVLLERLDVPLERVAAYREYLAALTALATIREADIIVGDGGDEEWTGTPEQLKVFREQWIRANASAIVEGMGEGHAEVMQFLLDRNEEIMSQLRRPLRNIFQGRVAPFALPLANNGQMVIDANSELVGGFEAATADETAWIINSVNGIARLARIEIQLAKPCDTTHRARLENERNRILFGSEAVPAE